MFKFWPVLRQLDTALTNNTDK